MLLRKEVRASLSPTWCRSTTHMARERGKNKPVKTTIFKKKKTKATWACYTCGDAGHFAKIQFVQIARRRLAMDLFPRPLTR
jgi:hypothetical protein